MNQSEKKRETSAVVGASESEATPGLVVRARRGPAGLPFHLSLPRQVAVVAFWPLLEQLMASFIRWWDMSLAGHLEVDAVASTNAVSMGNYVTWLMGLMHGAVGVGATALVARAVGANHKREANAAVGQSILLAILVGLVMAFGFYVGAPYFSAWFGLKGKTAEMGTEYLRILALVSPFMSVLFVGTACLRGAGDFRSAVLVMLWVNVVNAPLSWYLASSLGWGIRGIAIGTAAAWTFGGSYILRKMILKRSGARLFTHRLRWQHGMMRRLSRLGVPSLLEYVIYWAGAVVVVLMISHMGDPNLLGAHTIALQIESLSFLAGYALQLAAATMVGQYLGAGDARMAARATWVCLGYGAAIMSVIGVLFMVMPRAFVLIITPEAAYTEVVPELLFACGWSQVGLAASMVLAGALRGAGDVKMSMFLTLGSVWLIRFPAVLICVKYFDVGLTGIWVLISVELLLRGLLFLLRFMQGNWAKQTV